MFVPSFPSILISTVYMPGVSPVLLLFGVVSKFSTEPCVTPPEFFMVMVAVCTVTALVLSVMFHEKLPFSVVELSRGLRVMLFAVFCPAEMMTASAILCAASFVFAVSR